MAKKISEVFPSEYEGRERFGFKEGAELFVDPQHVKMIGNLCDFTLPENYVEVTQVGEDDTVIKYGLLAAKTIILEKRKIDKEIRNSLAELLKQETFARKDFADLNYKLDSLRTYEACSYNLIVVSKEHDTIVRNIIRNPKTYSTSVEKWPWAITYVGKKRVIVCAHRDAY